MTADTPTTTPPVDWDAVEEEIDCPLCDYNLRGLIEPRCPECGYRFEWPDMLDPRRRLHSYLYEHHPESGFKSFWRTALGGLLPRRFWRSLNPVQPSRPKRLLRYWCITASVLILTCVVEVGLVSIKIIQQNIVVRTRMLAMMSSPGSEASKQSIVKRYGSIQQFLDTLWPTNPVHIILDLDVFSDWRVTYNLITMLAIPLLWPWISFLALMVFQVSMKRARVRSIHLLRCTLYASDVILWIAIIHLLLALAIAVGITSRYFNLRMMGTITIVFPAILPLIATYRLAVAFHLYLRFDRPILTVLAAQVIVLLVGLILFWAPWIWLQ